jgi:hypothetical protein
MPNRQMSWQIHFEKHDIDIVRFVNYFTSANLDLSSTCADCAAVLIYFSICFQVIKTSVENNNSYHVAKLQPQSLHTFIILIIASHSMREELMRKAVKHSVKGEMS